MVLRTILMGLDSYGAYESTHKAELGITYMTLAAPCIGIAACALPILIARASQVGHHSKAAVLFVDLAARRFRRRHGRSRADWHGTGSNRHGSAVDQSAREPG